jgi:hypothetical protein
MNSDEVKKRLDRVKEMHGRLIAQDSRAARSDSVDNDTQGRLQSEHLLTHVCTLQSLEMPLADRYTGLARDPCCSVANVLFPLRASSASCFRQ